MTKLLPVSFRMPAAALRPLSLLLATLLALPALADNPPAHRSARAGSSRPAPQSHLPAPVPQPPAVHALVRPLSPSPAERPAQALPTPGAPAQAWHQNTPAPPGGGSGSLGEQHGPAPQTQQAPAGNGDWHNQSAPAPQNGQSGAGNGYSHGGAQEQQGGQSGQNGYGNARPDDGGRGQGWQNRPGGGQGYDNRQPQHRLVRVNQMPDNDRRNWQGGRWSHDNHGGYSGWWWVVGGSWYFYDSPVYPYPDTSTAVTMESDSYDDSADAAYDNAPAQASSSPAPELYYCSNPVGYSPQVPSCSTDWTPVPASPTADAGSDGDASSSSYWYYCSSSQGYYPYVQTCSTAWTVVTPSLTQAATAPQDSAPQPEDAPPPQAAPTPAPPPPPQQAQPSRYWYYCQSPAGYYPTVPTCSSDWIPVPAQASQ